MKAIKLKGKRFGKLIVLEDLPYKHMVSKIGNTYGVSPKLCLCDCGNTIIVNNNWRLRTGGTRSCGCLKHEVIPVNKSHGLTGTPEYVSWVSMRIRCKSHKNYGQRGIKVCKRWQKFENFLLDMGYRPSKIHSIERIDNEKGYFKSNCKWALPKEQVRNRRLTKKVIYNNKEIPLAELCELTGHPYSFLASRLRSGWTLEEALKYPRQTKISAMRKTPITHIINNIFSIELFPNTLNYSINRSGTENMRIYMLGKRGACLKSYSLPPGSWQILGLASELTEEQAGEVVEYFEVGRFDGYKDYEFPDGLIPIEYAINSFQTLLRSHNLNPDNLLILKKK